MTARIVSVPIEGSIACRYSAKYTIGEDLSVILDQLPVGFLPTQDCQARATSKVNL